MNKGLLLFLVACIVAGLITFGLIVTIYGDNVKNRATGFVDLYLPSDVEYSEVLDILVKEEILKDVRTFDWVANRMNYPNTVEGGKYIIPNQMSNRALVRQLRNGFGEQEIKLPLHSIHSKADLYERVSGVLETSDSALHDLFSNSVLLAEKGMTIDNGWATVLSDTYRFNWDTDAQEFLVRMQYEFNQYWNADRIAQAEKLELKPLDCIIIASIIEKESTKQDEYRRIAGVYVNRLLKDMPLQADPTVKFALNQPDLRRILIRHTEVDSPYNTYKYKGLPPGPIGLPEKTSIQAVLEAEAHDYLYFCAKDDFSGYHAFAKSYREHKQNARRYQKALNESGIF